MQVTVVVLGVLNGQYNCNSGNTKDYYFVLFNTEDRVLKYRVGFKRKMIY